MTPDATIINNVVRDDLPFRHYTRRHRLIAWISTHLFDRATYTVRHGLLKGMRRKGGLGWIPAPFSPAMTAEQRFRRDIKLDGMVVYDVGAFQGLLTLFFASRAKSVISFEPNTINHRRLTENVRLNGLKNVLIHKVGIGARREVRMMVGTPLMQGGASIDDTIVTSLLLAKGDKAVENISVVSLDEEIPGAGLPPPGLIKIDIEGSELQALRGASNTLRVYKPALLIEMHGETVSQKRDNALNIVNFLWSLGYYKITHVETGIHIVPGNSSLAMQGHLYCLSSFL